MQIILKSGAFYDFLKMRNAKLLVRYGVPIVEIELQYRFRGRYKRVFIPYNAIVFSNDNRKSIIHY